MPMTCIDGENYMRNKCIFPFAHEQKPDFSQWSILPWHCVKHCILSAFIHGSFHQVGARFVNGVNCYIRKCTIYYPWLWLQIHIVVISYWRWRDWFHSNLKNNCECALIIKDNRWYIYGCNNWHRYRSCPNLVEWPKCMYIRCKGKIKSLVYLLTCMLLTAISQW